ncbi:MAG: glutamate-5-semialdehyde dehydrogenase [Candidatus Magasanikbacteria bacterium]|nr:glutamate-5-semialdehyde dehydrogenase [Candidatus Magasanikbacteria bacterium]
MISIQEELQKVQRASHALLDIPEEKINRVLADLAGAIIERSEIILSANRLDLCRMGTDDPRYDRLELNFERLEHVAHDMRNVAALEHPIGRVLEERTLGNGLNLRKVSVPFGVAGIIYEARPNVTFDVFSLCFKSGNACVLKGGSEAKDSNEAIARLIHTVLEKHGVDKNVLYLAPTDREAVIEILNARGCIDVIIPRGSQTLINFVREHAKVPIIETGAGIVHTYFDVSGDLRKGKEIVFNAKTRRPSVCNALDTLLVHEDRLADLPELVSKLATEKVTLFADERAYARLEDHYKEELLHMAGAEHFGTEFLSLKMSIKTVSGVENAMKHITKYGSKHSEAIIAQDEKTIEYFLRNVDAAAVYANASTAFTDGVEFGLGSEIGISTQKLHARGPMALKELTSYKWMARGTGQIRK